MKYNVQLEISTSALVPAIGKIIDSVNESMHSFGFDEKMDMVTTLPIIVKTNRAMTTEEMGIYQKTLITHFKKLCKHVKVIKFEPQQ